MECCLLWNFYSLNQVRVQISQRRITPTLPLPATTNNYYFKKKTRQLSLSKWTVCQFLSITNSLSLSPCLSFFRVLLSAFLVTPDFTDLRIVPIPCLNDSSFFSVVYPPVYYLLGDIYPRLSSCDFICFTNLQLPFSKFVVKSANFDFWHVCWQLGP